MVTMSDRLAREIAAIEKVDTRMNARPIRLSGYIGGTDYRPIEWSGESVTYVRTDSGDQCFKFWPGGEMNIDSVRSMFIIDSVGYYVAGWEGGNPSDGYVLLHPITRIRNIKTGAVRPFLLRPARRAYVLWTSADFTQNGE